MTPDDDESMEKTTLTVKFMVYPYKIANTPKKYSFVIPASTEITATILNDSSHKVTPTLITDNAVTIKLDNISFSIPTGETTDGDFKLNVGVNIFTIKNDTETDCNLTVKFCEEVF